MISSIIGRQQISEITSASAYTLSMHINGDPTTTASIDSSKMYQNIGCKVQNKNLNRGEIIALVTGVVGTLIAFIALIQKLKCCRMRVKKVCFTKLLYILMSLIQHPRGNVKILFNEEFNNQQLEGNHYGGFLTNAT